MDPSVAVREQANAPCLDRAGAVARQRVLEHRGELRPGVEHDGDAERIASILRPQRPIRLHQPDRV